MENLDVFEITLFENEEQKNILFEFCKGLNWKQHNLKFQDKVVPIPRLIEWFGDVKYTYSGLTHPAKKMPKELELIKNKLEELCSNQLNTPVLFNSVLLNYYRNGNDSISFHADDEKELHDKPVIASISLGATRKFIFKNQKNNKIKKEYQLKHGTCIIMHGNTQNEWFHSVPKEKNITDERINLTFRFTHKI